MIVHIGTEIETFTLDDKWTVVPVGDINAFKDPRALGWREVAPALPEGDELGQGRPKHGRQQFGRPEGYRFGWRIIHFHHHVHEGGLNRQPR